MVCRKRSRSVSSETSSQSAHSSHSTSPNVQVDIQYSCASKKYNLTPRRKKYGKLLARSSNPSKSIALAALRDKAALSTLTNGMGKILNYELKKLCSDSVNSVQKSSDRKYISNFPWTSLTNEIMARCPTLLYLLLALTKTRTTRKNRIPVICCIVCILSKFRCSRMSLFQRLISSILYSGHVSSSTYDRLQKLMLCMSKNSTSSVIKLLGSDFDHKVLQWKDSLVPSECNISEETVLPISNSGAVLQGLINDDELEEGDTCMDVDANEIFSCHGDLNEQYVNIVVHDTEQFIDDSSSSIPAPTFSNVSDGCMEDDVDIGADTFLPNAIGDVNINEWSGFRIIGDNLDKDVKPRYVRVDKQTSSLHFFHHYAVKDRVNLVSFSDNPNPYLSVSVNDLPTDILLPSSADHQSLLNNFATLISRVLVAEFDYFKSTFDNVVVDHIPHCYSLEMGQKSETVPLGVILKNENVIEDMIDILLDVHKYVPVKPLQVYDEKAKCNVSADIMHPLLFGGDQLTRKRAESALEGRKNSTTPFTQLQGVIPICEDWHAKRVLLEVIWKCFYNTKSFLDKGTLCHLRNIINRRNVTASSDSDYNACDDFLSLVLKCHIMVASMQYFGMKNVSDNPNHPLLDSSTWLESDQVRSDKIIRVAHEIIKEFVDVEVRFKTGKEKKGQSNDSDEDQVQCYASEFLSLGLFYSEFSDSIREGDGIRILRCWRYMMLYFKASLRKNYAIEALNILGQYHFFLSPRQSQQLIWSRCVNTRGISGRNIPGDLLMEHLNRTCKNAVSHLGANKSPDALVRCGKCVGVLAEMLEKFDDDLGVTEARGVHSMADTTKDKQIILQCLLETQVFAKIQGRRHQSFQRVQRNLSCKINRKDLIGWMKEQLYVLRHKFY